MPDLSKEVANYLTDRFGAYFTAKHNSNVVYPQISQLKELQCDVWPSGLALQQKTRAGLSRVWTINIALQQRAASQEVVDILTNLADDVLTDLLLKRWLNGSVYSSDGSFAGTDVFDRIVRYEENVFQSVMEINFQKIN